MQRRVKNCWSFAGKVVDLAVIVAWQVRHLRSRYRYARGMMGIYAFNADTGAVLYNKGAAKNTAVLVLVRW